MPRQYLIQLTLNNGLVTGGVFDFLQQGDLPTISLTGDVTGAGATGVIPTVLKNTGTPGTYGQVTVDAQGRVTAGATCDVAHGGTGATSLTAHGVLLGEGTGAVVPTAAMTNGQLLVGQTGADPLPLTLSGDATLAAAGALTLATVNANVGTFGDATHVAQVTVDAKGRITAVANVAISGGGGGTPGGADTNVQFNDGGAFGGDSDFTWDKATKVLAIGHGAAPNLLIGGGGSGTPGFTMTDAAGGQIQICVPGAVLAAGAGAGETAATFSGSGMAVSVCDGTYAVSTTAGSINTPGTSGNTFRWNAGHSASGSGGFPGTPDAWALASIAGTDYLLPAYLP